MKPLSGRFHVGVCLVVLGFLKEKLQVPLRSELEVVEVGGWGPG